MLTQTEIEAFLTHCLGLTCEEIKMAHSDKLQFLRRLMKAFARFQPYQNLFHMSETADQRSIPGLRDNLEYMLQNQGGLCWTLNLGLYHILQEYNFDVHPIIASVGVPLTRKCHMMLIVKNVRKHDDTWLADTAFESPEYEPINMDFENESKVYELPDVTARWIKEGEYICRQHRVDPKLGARFPTVKDNWEYVFYFTMECCALDDISHLANCVCYSNKEHPLHHRIHIQGLAMHEGKEKFVRIRNDKLFSANESGKMVLTKKLQNDEEVMNMVSKYFPQIPTGVTQKAINNWRNRVKTANC